MTKEVDALLKEFKKYRIWEDRMEYDKYDLQQAYPTLSNKQVTELYRKLHAANKMKKVSKSHANYKKRAKRYLCKNCHWFYSHNNTCHKVAGRITPYGSCKYWEGFRWRR